MKHFIAALFLCFLSVYASAQESYAGGGIGYSEACRTKYTPGFAGGDCIEPNLDLRGIVGTQINDNFAIEGSLDLAFDSGDLVGTALSEILSDASDQNFYYTSNDASETDTNRWSITTLAVHALMQLPIAHSMRLFVGPSLGGSLVNFEYDVKYFGNGDSQSRSATEFGLNYGWTAGIDLLDREQGILRLQWQNWRSLDANVARNGQFNSNTLTVNFIGYF